MPNVFSTIDPSQPGYFRIGYVVLQIPPTDISTNRIINDDQISTIRGISPMFIKSGQARWDVSVRWKAVRFHNTDGTTDYSQWVDLRTIVAMFKAAPFVEVENAFLRQHFTNVQLTTQTQRMAFALRQIRIDTNPDSEDILDVTLTMSLFNYVPYSKDFGYVDESGNSVNSTDSTKFQLFISRWISRNMDNHPGSHSSPPVLPWTSQDEGVTTFLWREYTFVPFSGASSSLPPTSPASAAFAPTVPPPHVPKRVSSNTVKLSDDIQQIVNRVAPTTNPPLDPAVVTAQIIYESGGKNVLSPKGTPGHRAVGYMQVFPSTANKTEQQLLDPLTNITAGCQFLAQQLKTFGNYPHALGAYNAGPAYIYAYRDGKTQDHGKINPQQVKTDDGLPPAGIPNGENAPLYVKTILTNAGYAGELMPDVAKSTDGVPPKTQITQAVNSIADPTYRQQVLNAVPNLPNGGVGWFLDYYTEQGAFFFFDHTITLASADSPTNGDFDMFPNQLSVVMVNNLPLIPLAAMQYPTYQHVGPPDTMISIAFNSVGDDDSPINEPFHGGIQALAAMSSQLEEQFHNLRTLVRAVSSIHRMQAVFMQNKILNMLGIHGTMLRGLNTETVPEASDLAQVSLMASQYENIFEESSPYRINGIPAAYNKPMASILTSGQLDKLSPAEQQAIAAIKTFADKWAANDGPFLLSEILSIAASGNTLLTAATPAYDIMTDMANSTDIPDAQLRPDQQQYLLANLDLALTEKELNILQTAQVGFNNVFGGIVFTQKDQYPGLEKRRQVLLAPGKTMTFADVFVFTQLPVQADKPTTQSIQNQVATLFATQLITIFQAMYAKLFDWEMRTNPIFSREAQLLTNTPFFADQFKNTVSVAGPSSDPNNLGHECYKDLGLSGYKEDPAFYFVDYNQKVNDDTNGVLSQILGTANQSANDVNQTATVRSPGDPTKTASGTSTPFTGLAQGLPGQANALIRMTKIPGYDMASAYPTFKLMLIEEDNTGPFFAFDNFYSYASVQDIEIIKYQDKPDTAIIQITNLAHLLQHRLFDDSAAGKLEKEADKTTTPGAGFSSTGEALTGGNPVAGLTASKTAAGVDYQLAPRKNMTEGRDEASKRVPLKYFALQTGAKIQIRMGFANNPDNLYPVFTGFVTQIDGDDTLIITAQSFQLELMNIPGTLVKTDSYLGFNFLSGGAAFGGYQIMNSGTTTNILQTLLTAPTARHFGHWQIGGIKDPLIKGFSWSELIGTALTASNNSTISTVGHLLQSGYDRSGENILVNSIVNFDATQDVSSQANNSRRTFQNENPNVFLGTAAYSIPKQSKLNLWEIMKDVSRRYPWYNLMVRPYGFPYGADATLVYAHPLDWYYARPRLMGESEKEAANNITHGALFQQWWNSVGQKKFVNIFTQGKNEAASAANQVTTANVLVPGGPATLSAILDAQQAPQTQEAGSGPEGFAFAIQSMHNILNGLPDPNAGFLTYLSTQIANFGNISAGLFQALDAEFQALYREWEGFLHLSDPASNSSRLHPVRQYHLIDHSHIVHNGIVVNDEIYNAVKIKDRKPLVFNQNIPPQHIRCLDVTDMINNVDTNVLQGVGEPMLNAYAQSFLREEVGKMYQGELVLRGVPEIEPFDVILLSDPSTGTVGPIEVDSVIHSFNITEGFITIVKPKALLIVNESCSLGLIASMGLAWSGAQANLMDLGHIFNPFNINTTVSARALEAAGGVGGALALAAGLAFTTTPVGLGVLTLVAGLGIMVYSEGRSKDNMFKIMPLTRFGRPWLGGLQGFAISNFAYSLNKSFQWFDAEEIAPTIESWNELLNYRADNLYTDSAAQ